eukprot:JP446288.1.p1 GENE.JP446288.1~~JP446288.1.p1  ORF type:complete len:334 (-),score=128.52 JP446288.1:96-1097(-)
MENQTGEEAPTKGEIDGQCAVKILIPNYAAGALIGKGGAAIAELQNSTGARIKLSASRDFFPGTTERVALVTGSLEVVIAVLSVIMDKIRDEPPSIRENSTGGTERARQVKLAVPNSTAGYIIGKSGNNIKMIQERTGSRTQISPKDAHSQLQERVVTISGDHEQNLMATALLLAKVQEDPNHAAHIGQTSYSQMIPTPAMQSPYAGGAAPFPSYGSSGAYGGMGGAYSPYQIPPQSMGMSASPQQAMPLGGPQTTVEIEVPDNMIGAIVGSGGKTIRELQQYSGARITISQRGDLVPGTSNRKVTVVGSAQATQTAHFLIVQKMQQEQQQQQ